MSLTLAPAIEQRIQQQLADSTYDSPDALIAHALDLVAREQVTPQEDWLLLNREDIQRGLKESFAAKARGESYSADEVQSHLAARRSIRAAA